ncbi:hypothetical protein D3C71_1127810 [compost metagenome]
MQQGAHVGVLLDEAWQASGSQSRHVLPDQHLGIAVDTGAYAHRGDGDRCRDFLGNLGRHHLDEQSEGAGSFEGEGGVDKLLAILAPSLHAVATELMLCLRGEAYVGHHRNTRAHQFFHLGQHPLVPLEFHGMGAAFLHEAHRSMKALLGGALIGAKGEIRYHQRAAGGAGHGPYQRDQLVHSDRERGLVAIDVVGGGVSHQQHRDPCLFKNGGGIHIVRGQHGPLLSLHLHLLEVGDPDAGDGLGERGVLTVWGGVFTHVGVLAGLE